MSEETDQHKIDETIETLASKLYFHGHPINRREARLELGLKVVETVPPALETVTWKLYLDFEEELKNKEAFDPMVDIFNAAGAPEMPQPGQASIIPPGTMTEGNYKYALVESSWQSSVFVARRRFVVAASGQQCEPLVRTETLSQGWSHRQAPVSAPAA
jgi:hypothetical protein